MMIQRRQTDEGFVNAIKGNSAYNGLADLKVQLALVQAALLMALEGSNRASASQITERAVREYGIEATASFTGQVFASLGIGTTVTRGKSRFILEHDRLEEIKKGIVTRGEELAGKLESSITFFQNLTGRIESLEKEWQNVLKLRAKERELFNFINEERNKPSRLPQLEAEANKYRAQMVRADELQKECAFLSRKIKRMPSLEKKEKQLNSAIKEHENRLKAKEQETEIRERQIAAKEKEQAERIASLQKRAAWADLADLQYNIELAQTKLKEIEKEISSNQSFLERLLRRKAGDQ